MTVVHSYRKHQFVKGFYCWLYLACVAGAKQGKGKAQMREEGCDEEVASSKKNGLKTRVQKWIPYL